MLVTGFRRIEQLRALIRRLEALPTSPERDALLVRARDRVVTLEIGAREVAVWQVTPRRQPTPKPTPKRNVSRPVVRARLRPTPERNVSRPVMPARRSADVSRDLWQQLEDSQVPVVIESGDRV